MKQLNKSPLKNLPLRYPGQSLDQQRLDLAFDKLLVPLMAAVFMIAMAGLEWWRYFNPHPPNPIIYSLFALLVILYAVWQIWRTLPTIRQLRLASDGEKIVGQFLERLRESGYQIFHDVIGEGFNLDHVVIGPTGIFTIETKTRSKPVGRQSKIVFDGEKILVDGFEPDRDPVIQAKAQASWLRELLLESTGRKFAVRPVVVFPYWFIEQIRGSTRDIWVLEPKALPAFLANEPSVLVAEDITLASYHLSCYVRANEKARREEK
jgi:hypothetical protein